MLLAAVLVVAAAIFISQLDLDDYRQELEQELGDILELPVKIGRAALTYRQGLALELDDLRIGSAERPLVEVPQLTAILQVRPLLDGQFVFEKVLVERPKLQIWLQSAQRPERGATQDLLSWLGIRILTVEDAELVVHQQLEQQNRQLLHLQELYLVLTGWESGKTGQLVINGQYQQARQPAEFTIELGLPSSTDPEHWRNENIRSRLSVQNLSTELLPKLPGNALPSSIDLFANLDGIPAAGARVQATVRSHSDREELLELSGNWQSSTTEEILTQLTGPLLGLPIKADLKLERQERGQRLTGQIDSAATPLTPKLLANWQIPQADKLQAGQLKQLSLAVTQQWPAGGEPTGQPQLAAALKLSGLQWNSPQLRHIQDFSIELSLTEQQLIIKDALAVADGHRIHLTGQIDTPFAQPTLNLNLSAKPQLALFKQQLALPDDWQLTGEGAISLQLKGAAQEPIYRLDLNLTGADLTLGKLLQKPAGQTAKLQAEGLFDKTQLEIDKVRLQLNDVKLSGEGLFPLKNVGQTFLFDLDEFELAQLQQLSPLLQKLQLVGKAHLFLDRQQNGIQANLRLAEVGAHLFYIVNDLQRTSGEIQFDQQGLSFSNLNATLGESPLMVSGELESWENPQLKFQVKGDKVRAQDLIFRNQQLTLYDLDGRLRVTASDLYFDEVKVRLEEATLATVKGKVADFSDPQTILDIESTEADILAVIKLFIGPDKRPASQQPPQHKDYKPLVINVKADQGTLGGLRFEQAQGTITDHQGIFSIYPLSFKSGPGYCFARVEIDRTREHGLLKVSGHAEDLDASVLHEDVFLKRGLVSGRLRGDFYLEGEPGDNFWPTARGGIYLQLKDGALRKFRGLAQVFSILNVSQLFALKMPDMAEEGMPFDLLQGSIRVADGLMTTKDLHIVSEAMNMALVGTKNLIEDSVDFDLSVMPLRTVDKVITSIPVAGWVLTGDEKALLSAQFKIKGPGENPEVTAVPISTVSGTLFGIIKRTVGLPYKLIKDIDALFKTEPQKK